MTERQLIDEVNALRTNPATWAAKINASKTYFEGNIWKHPNSKAGIKTNEGPAAYEEAIRALKQTPKVDALVPSKGLCRIAEEFLREYQKDANANVEMDSVIDKYGKFTGNFRRLVEFGGINAEQSIINLVVSDGDKDRGHRQALLADNLTRIGVAHGEHGTYRNCSVIVMASTFENTYDSNDSYY